MVSAMDAGARSEDALAALLLTTRLGDTGEEPFSVGAFWSLVATVPAPAELFGTSAGDLARRTGLQHDDALRIERLLTGATSLAFALERSERQGFVTMTPFDGSYPERLRRRLGDQAPPVLFAVGACELLSAEGIGVVGPRAGGGDGAGGAPPGGPGGGGGYLADSLSRCVREPSTRRALAAGSTCLATPFSPTEGFSAANALGRNKLIY